MNKKAFVATLCVAVLLVTLAAGCRDNQPMAPDGGGGNSPGVTTTTTIAATTATIKDEPLATVTGDEMTGTTTTTVNTSSVDKTEATTQGSSASVTKGTTSKPTKTQTTKATNTTATKATSGKKDYLDTSKLTGTQEDVGKVVGYSSLFDKEVTVVEVTECVTLDGLKYIETYLSDYTSIVVMECKYCHEMPCPDGGNELCSQYDVQFDSTKTCQHCGLPTGDGYNGTCYGTIDWDNGGMRICHHYD